MAKPALAAPEKTIEIPKMNLQKATLTVIGTAPLICHKWSDKAKEMMLNKQMKKAKVAKEAKNPERDFYESLYWLDGMPGEPSLDDVLISRFGFPAVGFKSAAVDACSHVDGITKVAARGCFHIDGEMVEILGDKPVAREDMVRIAMGTADIRYRGEFKQWYANIPLTYNANVLSVEQIVNLFNTAGFAIGVGEWRPSKDGSYGRFEVGNAPVA